MPDHSKIWRRLPVFLVHHAAQLVQSIKAAPTGKLERGMIMVIGIQLKRCFGYEFAAEEDEPQVQPALFHGRFGLVYFAFGDETYIRRTEYRTLKIDEMIKFAMLSDQLFLAIMGVRLTRFPGQYFQIILCKFLYIN